jgi:hypothetical protein
MSSHSSHKPWSSCAVVFGCLKTAYREQVKRSLIISKYLPLVLLSLERHVFCINEKSLVHFG